MLNKLIKYCIDNAFITLVIFGVITLLSIVAIYKTPMMHFLTYQRTR